jgi:hypothetical protein
MLLETGPIFENHISLGSLVTSITFVFGAVLSFGRKFWLTDQNEKSMTKLTELVEKTGVTQGQIVSTQAVQQQLMEGITKNSEQSRIEHKEQMAELKKEHGERITRLETEVFFAPTRHRGIPGETRKT